VTIERHSRMRQIELGQRLASRRKVYLDACFWIMVRDAALGIRTGASERKILHFLRRGVRAGTIVCPISASMFMELMKQPFTPERRIATARLIDELSLGVSIMAEHMVMGTEISAFLHAAQEDVSLPPLQELVWTKVSYVLGDIYPALDLLSPDEELEMQKKFFDHLWDQSLSSMIETIGNAPVPGDHFQALSKDTNVQTQIYRDELKSYEGTYDIELRGVIEVVGDVAADIIGDMAAKATGQRLVPTPEERAETVKMCRNLLYHAMKQRKHRAVLRTLHVGVSLHSGMRWDKERKFKPNDYYDFQHATTALSYCDYFLTDGPLHILITQPQLDLERVNGCKVLSDPAEAAEAMRVAARPA
jgi:hypothetical protein